MGTSTREDGGVAIHVAFLRAINLGATRKFSPAQITAACESVGCTEVATHINTGNVRFTTSLRSRAKIESMLEGAFESDRGFAVPTIVLTRAEITQIVADAVDLGADLDAGTKHYVSVLKDEPSAEDASWLEGESSSGERAFVRGRAVHLLQAQGYQGSRLTNAVVEKRLGVATNRNVTVMRAIDKKWC